MQPGKGCVAFVPAQRHRGGRSTWCDLTWRGAMAHQGMETRFFLPVKNPDPTLSFKKVWVQNLLNLYLCKQKLWKRSSGRVSSWFVMLCHCMKVIYYQRAVWGGGCSPLEIRVWKGMVLLEVFNLTHESLLVSGTINKKRRRVAAGGCVDEFTEVCLSSEYQTVAFMSALNCIITDGG